MNSLETSRIGLFPKPILILHLTLAMGWLGIAGCEKRMQQGRCIKCREELPAVDIDNDTTTPQKSLRMIHKVYRVSLHHRSIVAQISRMS